MTTKCSNCKSTLVTILELKKLSKEQASQISVLRQENDKYNLLVKELENAKHSNIKSLDFENSERNGIKLNDENELKNNYRKMCVDMEKMKNDNADLLIDIEKTKSDFEDLQQKYSKSNKNVNYNKNEKKIKELELELLNYRRENDEMKMNLELKDNYIKTLQEKDDNNLIMENKKLYLEREEFESKLIENLKACQSCHNFKDSTKSLKETNKVYQRKISLLESQKASKEREIIEFNIAKKKLENENDKMYKQIDIYKSLKLERTEELTRMVSTMKGMILKQNDEIIKDITKSCQICQGTAKLIFDCFKGQIKYKAYNLLSQKILNDYKHVKFTLLKHVQQSLITHMVNIDGKNDIIESIKEIIKAEDNKSLVEKTPKKKKRKMHIDSDEITSPSFTEDNTNSEDDNYESMSSMDSKISRINTRQSSNGNRQTKNSKPKETSMKNKPSIIVPNGNKYNQIKNTKKTSKTSEECEENQEVLVNNTETYIKYENNSESEEEAIESNMMTAVKNDDDSCNDMNSSPEEDDMTVIIVQDKSNDSVNGLINPKSGNRKRPYLETDENSIKRKKTCAKKSPGMSNVTDQEDGDHSHISPEPSSSIYIETVFPMVEADVSQSNSAFEMKSTTDDSFLKSCANEIAAEIQRSIKTTKGSTEATNLTVSLERKLNAVTKQLSEKKSLINKPTVGVMDKMGKHAKHNHLLLENMESFGIEKTTSDSNLTQTKNDSMSEKTLTESQSAFLKGGENKMFLNVNVAQLLTKNKLTEEQIEKFQQITTFTSRNAILPEMAAPPPQQQEPDEEESVSPDIVQPTVLPKSPFDLIIEDIFAKLVDKNETEMNEILTRKICLNDESNAKGFVDGIFHFFQSTNHRAYKRNHILKTTYLIIVSVIRQYQKIYPYYYSTLLNFLPTGQLDSVIVLTLSNINFYLGVKQWDFLMNFLVALLRLQNIPIIRLISYIIPQHTFPSNVHDKYSPVIDILKRIVTFEYSTTQEVEVKKIVDKMSLDSQRFWLQGQVVEYFSPTRDLQPIIRFVKKTMSELASSLPQLKMEFLDRDLEKKYLK